MKRAVLVLTLMLLLSGATTSRAASSLGDPTNNYWANNGKPQSADNSALVEIILVVAIAIPNLLKT